MYLTTVSHPTASEFGSQREQSTCRWSEPLSWKDIHSMGHVNGGLLDAQIYTARLVDSTGGYISVTQ